MHSRIARLLAPLAMAVLLAGCEADRPLAPPSADQASLAASGAPGLEPPSNLTSTAASSSRIDLTWRDNSSKETGFEVHRSTTGPAGVFGALATTGANVTTYSDAGLNPLAQYCYNLRARRTSGGKTSYSPFSNTSCSTTPGPPPAPSSADATPASSSAVDVAWADNSGTEDGFRVGRSAASTGPWEVAATTAPNVTSYRDAGRPSEQQVCYRLVAFNAHGDSGPSSTDCTAPPAGPTNLVAASPDAGRIDLTWADASSVEDAYEVRRSTDGVTFSVVASVPANSTSYQDVGVTGSTTYWYRVRAKKDGGFSDFSNTASATTPAPPDGGSCADGPERACDNGVDDDCDGAVDSADPDCSNCTDPTEQVCDNWADDDCDGLVDGADPDCPAPPCDFGCPPGMVCYPNGFCYYPPSNGEL